MQYLQRLTIASSFAVIFALGSIAFGQTTAPAVPMVTPAPNCENPGEPPGMSSSELGKSASEMKRNNWLKKMKAHLDCLKTFISDQQAAATPHVKAANSAVEDFNKSI